MASKLKVDQIEGQSGTSVEVPTGHTFKVTDLGNNKILSTNSSGVVTATAFGTASQKLRINSSGNALEFFTEPAVTSEMVKLGSTSFSSGTPSEVTLDVTFDDSTYYKYELMGFVTCDSTAANMNVRLRNGGSNLTDSQYDYVYDYAYRRFSTNVAQASYSSNEDNDAARIFDWNMYAEDYPLFFKIESMAEMQNTTRYKTFQSQCIGYRHGSGGDYMHSANHGFFAYEGSTSAIEGISFSKTSGNFKTGHIAWYGFKR